MPDVPAHGAPANWGDAFARMPAESPAPDGWQRVAGTKDAGADLPFQLVGDLTVDGPAFGGVERQAHALT